MNAGIYKIENVLNGHCYIGQSIRLKKRKSKHFWQLEKNKHHSKYLQRAFNKYGKENFTFDVLLYCEPFELTRYEQKLVDSIDPKYNICKECVNSIQGTERTEETKRKISFTLTGRKRSEEERLNISLGNIGNSNASGNTNRLGKKLSKETKIKMSLAQTGRIITEEHKKKLSISAKKRWEERKKGK